MNLMGPMLQSVIYVNFGTAVIGNYEIIGKLHYVITTVVNLA